MPELSIKGKSARVIIASTRAAAGEYADRTGPLLRDWLLELGFAVPEVSVVPDGAPVGAAIGQQLADSPALILTSGGTGISPSDKTPEETVGYLDTQIPGIIEAIRAKGREQSEFAALSRGYAGLAGNTLIVNLPGSVGGVKDSMAILGKLLPHIFDQLQGGGH